MMPSCCWPKLTTRSTTSVHLIYRARPYEGIAKDFEFSRRTMEEHWQAGYNNARQSLANPEVLELPNRLEGVRTFDIGEARA